MLVDTGDAPELTELTWCGGTAHAGDVALRPEIPTIRCSMPTRVQPGLDADPDVLRTINAHADRCLGVYAGVARGGRLSVGDAVRIVAPQRPTTVAATARRLRDGAKRHALRASGKVLP